MSRTPYVSEKCPICQIEFITSSVANPVTKRNMGKICPNGHWTRCDVLAALRKGRPVPGKPKPELPAVKAEPAIDVPVVRKTITDYSLALEGMVSAFERLESQFPAGTKAHGMLVGAFLQPVIIGKKVLGRIA